MTHHRLAAGWFVAWAAAAAGAEHSTPNFLVTAPYAELAQQIAQEAERCRRSQALEWLGEELPPWPKPCVVTVILTGDGDGGETEFKFERGQVRQQRMRIQGRHDRLLESVLPHEVTHTIFAARFGRPVPRWADEGGAVLSEDYLEHRRHDLECRKYLNAWPRANIPLRRLFALTEYPHDMMALYTEGFSVAKFLVGRGGKPKFLTFVEGGLFGDWDGAARREYGFKNVDALETAWIEWLRDGRNTGANPQDPVVQAIAQSAPAMRRAASPGGGAARVVRGQAPDEDAPLVAASSRGAAPRRTPAQAAVRPAVEQRLAAPAPPAVAAAAPPRGTGPHSDRRRPRPPRELPQGLTGGDAFIAKRRDARSETKSRSVRVRRRLPLERSRGGGYKRPGQGAATVAARGERSDDIVPAALRRLHAEPGLRLFAAGKAAGVFPQRSAAALRTAELLLQRGLIDAAEDGSACHLTVAGAEWLREREDPRELLEDVLRATEAQLEEFRNLANLCKLQADRLEGQRANIAELLARLPATPKAQTAAESAILDILAEAGRLPRPGAGTVADLYERLRARRLPLTVGQFHDTLRALRAAGRLRLSAWTGPLYELPEPALALLVGHEVLYYVQPVSGACAA